MNLQERFKRASNDRDNDNIELAINEYNQIRDEALAEGEKEVATACLHMIGVSYSQSGDYQKAEEYYQKAQQEFEEEGNKVRVGAVLRDRASTNVELGDFDQAEKLMQQSIETLAQTDDLNHLGMSKVKMGIVLLKQEKLEQAEGVIKEGIKDLEKTEDNFFHSTAYFNLAEVQKELGQVNEAKHSLDKSLELLNKIAGPDEHLRRRQKIEELHRELNSEAK